MVEIRQAMGKLESLIHLVEITPLNRERVWKVALEAIEAATETIRMEMGGLDRL